MIIIIFLVKCCYDCRYKSLVGTVAKKFMKKRDRSKVEESTESCNSQKSRNLEKPRKSHEEVQEDKSTSGETPRKKKKRTFMKPRD